MATAAPGPLAGRASLAAVARPDHRLGTPDMTASTRTASTGTGTAAPTTGPTTPAASPMCGMVSRTTPGASRTCAEAGRLIPGASRLTTPAAGGRLAGSPMTPVAGATGTAGGLMTPAASRMSRPSAPIRAGRLERCRPLVSPRVTSLRPGRRPSGNHLLAGRRAGRRRSASRWRTGSQRTGPRVTGLLQTGRPVAGQFLAARRVHSRARAQGQEVPGRTPGRRTARRPRAGGRLRLRAGGQGTGLWTLQLRASGVLTPGTRARRQPVLAAATAVTATLGWPAARCRPPRQRHRIQGWRPTRGWPPTRGSRAEPAGRVLALGLRLTPGSLLARERPQDRVLRQIRDSLLTLGAARALGPALTRDCRRSRGSGTKVRGLLAVARG
jgi:hypothetical protein